MPYVYKKTNYLSNTELTQLRFLLFFCEKEAGVSLLMPWESLSKKRDISGHLLCFDRDQCIAYCGIFLFDVDAMHVFACVHPHYRRKKIFTHLFQMAKEEMLHWGIHSALVPFPTSLTPAHQCLQQWSGHFAYSEYRLVRQSRTMEEIPSHTAQFRLATRSDIEVLVKIQSECFESDDVIIRHRFHETIQDAHRAIWMMMVRGECMGKAHLRIENDVVWIHDVAIRPIMQHQGYGTLLLKYIINALISAGYFTVRLEVLASNESALRLYQHCGFTIEVQYDYWRLTF